MPIHTEKKTLPYTARQMYDLVANVAAYPEFLPWCAQARIKQRHPFDQGEKMDTDLVISFKLFREKFGTHVVLWDDLLRIDTTYLDGPFKYLQSQWKFSDRPEGGCDVYFFVDFEFRNLILRKVIGLVFDEAMHRIVQAFENRAAQLYGSSVK